MIGLFAAPRKCCYHCGRSDASENMHHIGGYTWLCEYCAEEAEQEAQVAEQEAQVAQEGAQ